MLGDTIITLICQKGGKQKQSRFVELVLRYFGGTIIWSSKFDVYALEEIEKLISKEEANQAGRGSGQHGGADVPR